MENKKAEKFMIYFYKIFNIVFIIIGIFVFFLPVIHSIKNNEVDWLTVIISLIEAVIVVIYEYGLLKAKEAELNEKLQNSKKDKRIRELVEENCLLKERIKEETKV